MKRKRILLKIATAILATAMVALLLVNKRSEPRPSRLLSQGARSSGIEPLSAKNVSRTIAPLKRVVENFTKIGSVWNEEITEPSAADFVAWVRKFQTASEPEKTTLENEGAALAFGRQKFLAGLIRTNPERALQLAVPLAVRRELPASIQEFLEERISGRGELAVLGALAEPGKETKVTPIFRTVTIGDKEFEAFTYGRRLGKPTRQNIPLNGIAVGNLMAVNENPVRILEPIEADEVRRSPETVCSISGESIALHHDETPVDVGGEIIFLCQRAHVDDLNNRIVAAEAGGTSPVGGTQALVASEGQKRLLLIRVDFPDLVGVPFPDSTGSNLVSGLNGFYSESSYGRAGFALVGQGSEYTPTFRMPTNSSYYTVSTRYNQLRTDARNAASAAGYVLANFDYDLVCMGAVQGYNWSGLGYVGAPGAWIRNNFGIGVSAHELGHNFGLNHANFWDTSGLSVIGDPGTNVEYGDSFDTMGVASAGNNHFNVRNKRALNWLRTNEITVVTNSGTYRIFCHDNTNSTGIRGLSLAKNSATNYWVEFRQKFTSNPWLTSGAILHWAQTGIQQSLLLDATPGTVDGKTDSALVIGRTFSDIKAGIHVTPIGKGGTSPESIDVVINKGTFSTNLVPTIFIVASATNVSSGALVNFTATANDANGDALACYWDFGDGTFGTNGTTASKSWSSGEYVVRCVVTDMKGGVASDSIVVRVGSPTTFRISGRVLTNNIPVEGVRVYVSAARTTYTDSDGTYNLVGLSAGSFTVSAQLDGYTFSYPTYASAISVGPNVTDANFNASPAIPPSIVSQPQSFAVAEGTDLTFNVVVGGAAPFTYRWLFEGTPLLNETNPTLTILNARLTNAGNYSVIVSNLSGAATSSNATLSVNAAPVLATIPNRLVNAGAVLVFTNFASDANLPANSLSFSLGSSPLPGASVDPASGVFTWAAPASEVLLTNRISLVVTDNGVPSLSDTASFEIVVVPPPRIAAIVPSAEGFLSFQWQTYPGKTYLIQYKNNFQEAAWTDWGSPVIAASNLISTDEDLAGHPQRFYRILQVD